MYFIWMCQIYAKSVYAWMHDKTKLLWLHFENDKSSEPLEQWACIWVNGRYMKQWKTVILTICLRNDNASTWMLDRTTHVFHMKRLIIFRAAHGQERRQIISKRILCWKPLISLLFYKKSYMMIDKYCNAC